MSRATNIALGIALAGLAGALLLVSSPDWSEGLPERAAESPAPAVESLRASAERGPASPAEAAESPRFSVSVPSVANRAGLTRAQVRFEGGRPWKRVGKRWELRPVAVRSDEGVVLHRHTPTLHGGKSQPCELVVPDSVNALVFGAPGYQSVSIVLPEVRENALDLGEVVLIADATAVVRLRPVPDLGQETLRVQIVRGGPGAGEPRKNQSYSREATAGGVLRARLPVPSGDRFFVAVGCEEGGRAAWGMLPQVSEVFALAPGEEHRIEFDLREAATLRGRLDGIPPEVVAGQAIEARLDAAAPKDEVRLAVAFRTSAVTDSRGKFAIHGLHPGTVSLQLDSHSSFLLAEANTRRSRWELPVEGELVVAPVLQPIGLVVTRDGASQRVRHSLGFDRPASDRALRETVGFATRNVLTRISRLFVFAEGSGHFSVPTSGLEIDADGMVHLRAPAGAGSILVQNPLAASLSWRLVARMSQQPPTIFPQSGFPGRTTAEGWLVEDLEPGDYRLHFYDTPNWARRSDVPGVFVVRAGRQTMLAAQPPRFHKIDVQVTNWEEIPPHWRPRGLRLGRVAGQVKEGRALLELPEPVAGHVEAAFFGRGFSPPVTTRDVAFDGASSASVRFPLDQLSVVVKVQPRFAGTVHLAVFLPRNPGEPSWGVRATRVERGPRGAFTLAVPANGEPIEGCVQEQHPELGRTLLRGWFQLAARPQRTTLDPGGRWVKVSLQHETDACRVLLRGPAFADGVDGVNSDVKLSGTTPTSIWVPDRARELVFRSSRQGVIAIPVSTLGDELTVGLPYRDD